MEAPAARPRLTNKTLFVLGAMNMIDCINVNLLTPYVVRMVAEFLNTDTNNPKVFQTVGLLTGMYSLCEVIFSPFWGILSDRIGRKPALLIGLGGSCAAPIMFGLGTNLTTVFIARALDGFFCGNMGVTRTYLGEIVDETNEARGFGFLATCFSFGLFIGPALGGELVYPAERYPSVFRGTIFDTYPYLLPNLSYASCAALAWVIGAIFLEETLPRSARRGGCCGGGAVADTAEDDMVRQLSRQLSQARSERACGTDPTGTPRWQRYDLDDEELIGSAFLLDATPPQSRRSTGTGMPFGLMEATLPPSEPSPGNHSAPSPSNHSAREVSAAVLEAPGQRGHGFPRVLTQVIVAYCAIGGFAAANSQMFVLLVSIPKSDDGFGLGPSTIGLLQNVAAVGLLLTQCLLYAPCTRRFGYFYTFYGGFLLMATAWSLWPLYVSFNERAFRLVPLGFLQLSCAIGGCFMFPTAFALINRASVGMDKGAVNGWANSCGALARALFPPAAGWLLSVGDRLHVGALGRYLAVYLNIAVAASLLAFGAPGVWAASRCSVGHAAVSPQPPPRPAEDKPEEAPAGGIAGADGEWRASGRRPLVGS